MADTNDVAVPTEAQHELKSKDTSSKADVIPEVKPEAEKPKVEPKEETKPEAADTKPPEGDDAPDADSQQRQKRMPRWMKERLERERQVTEARTREAMLREFQERQASQVEPPQAEPESVKTIEDFDFDQNAYLEYLTDQKVEKRLQQAEEKRRQTEEARKQAEAAESFKKRIDAFEERAGDGSWEDIQNSPINTDPSYKPLTDLFLGDEHDLDIAYHLAQNIKEAERIKALPRLSQIRELAKIAERFDSSSDGVDTPPPAPTVKKTTSAPPPVKTVSGAGKPSVDIRDPNMTTEQRIKAWRNAKKG